LCRGFKRFEDNYFDLAIVDPPYGIGAGKKSFQSGTRKSYNHTDKDWDASTPTDEYWNELFRVSKNQIVWGGNNFELPTSEYFIVWDKGQMMPSFARCEMAWTNCKVPAKIYAKRSQDLNRIHPTQKPTALYDWLLMNYAKEGDLILDTHLGSGSSRIAAYKGGFNFVGFEIDKEYYEKQEKRFNDFKSQLRLF
jgi:site-specific DNA-methyltransferase (adenine-specific)